MQLSRPMPSPLRRPCARMMPAPCAALASGATPRAISLRKPFSGAASAAPTPFAARRAAGAHAVALPPLAPRREGAAAPTRGPAACRALGLKTLGAGILNILKFFGISAGSAPAPPTAAAGEAAAAGQSAAVAAAGAAVLQSAWWAVGLAAVVGALIGGLLSYFGVPQVGRGGCFGGSNAIASILTCAGCTFAESVALCVCVFM
jgi:hypothetical protein